MRDHNRSIEVVAHGGFAFFAQTGGKRIGSTGRSLQLQQPGIAFEESFESFFGSFQCFAAKIDRAPVVSLQNKEADGHRAESFTKQGVSTGKKLFQRNKITQRLSHFLSTDGNHVVVHPVAHRIFTQCSTGLRNFAFMVWKHQVHPTAVDVELFAQVFSTHGRAFHMPTRETFAPGSFPAHDMFGRRLFPQRKIHTAAFFALSVEFAGSFEHLFHIASREFTIPEILVVLLYIKIHRTLTFVSITCFQNFLGKLDLLHDMARSMRFDVGG